MRHSNVVTGAGRLRLPSKHLLLLLVLAVLAGWALFSFAQESYLDFQLNSQANHLDRQNQALAAQNDGYRRDTLALQSGAAAEEDARLNGYAKGDERVYLVGPAPSPSPAARPSRQARAGAPPAGFWGWLLGVFRH
jgi:cell division protein FtsB